MSRSWPVRGTIRAMPKLSDLTFRFGFVLLCGMMVSIAAPLAAQDGGGSQEPQTPVRTRGSSTTGSKERLRPPLLREGGYLVRAPGTVQENRVLGVHLFLPRDREEGGIQRELILLPSRAMDDLVSLLENMNEESPESVLTIELTGKVLAYRGRNFILPNAVVRANQPSGTLPESTDDVGALSTEEEMSTVSDEDALARSIEERLEQRIGAVPRSVRLRDAAKNSPPRTLGFKPGTHLQERRGHLVRDPSSGTWRFVFDGSSQSLELLPCTLLQTIERQVRQSVVPTAIVISGRVTGFQGRNYLLPSNFRTAREGRGIGP